MLNRNVDSCACFCTEVSWRVTSWYTHTHAGSPGSIQGPADQNGTSGWLGAPSKRWIHFPVRGCFPRDIDTCGLCTLSAHWKFWCTRSIWKNSGKNLFCWWLLYSHNFDLRHSATKWQKREILMWERQECNLTHSKASWSKQYTKVQSLPHKQHEHHL